MMAKLADSERTFWELAGQVATLREACLKMQQVLAALARRQGGVLVISAEELAAVPPDAVLRRAGRPDGRIVIRVETGERDDEQRQPGSEG